MRKTLSAALASTAFLAFHALAAPPPLPEAGPWKQISFLTDKQKAAGRTAGGEGGQQITCISWSPADPSRVAFGVDVGGVWASSDGGKSWKMRKGDMLPNKIQAGVAIDPANPNVIYAWSIPEVKNDKFAGLYRTLDGGVSWIQAGRPSWSRPYGGWGHRRFAFLQNPEADKALGRTACVFTCGGNAILVSKNGGDSFSRFGMEFPGQLPEDFHVAYLYLEQGSPLRLLAATNRGLFRVSEKEIQALGEGLPEKTDITGFARHPSDPGKMWAVVDKRLFKSVDGGESFSEIMAFQKFSKIFVSETDGNVLYNPEGYGTIYYSHDGGETWNPGKIDDSLSCRHSGGWSQGFATHPKNPEEALACFGDRIFRTVDGGKTWIDSSTGWTGTRTTLRNSFYFHPDDKRVMGIGFLDWGMFYTVNGGDTWRYCWAMGTPAARNIFGLLLDPRCNWQSPEGSLRILAYSGGWDKQILMRSEDGGAWRTPAEGRQTWIRYDKLVRNGRLSAYNSKRPGMVYMGKQKSLDWGMTWKEMAQPADAMCFSNPDVLYSIHKYNDGIGLLRSKDCGETWEELKGRIKGLNDIEVAPDNPNVVYAGGHGVAMWENGAWKSFGPENGLLLDGFGHNGCSSVAIDPKHPERIYAGAWADYMGNSSGVWASSDRGATWRNISCNLGPMSIWSLAVSPHDGSVYIGSSYGHWVLPGGLDAFQQNASAK